MRTILHIIPVFLVGLFSCTGRGRNNTSADSTTAHSMPNPKRITKEWVDTLIADEYPVSTLMLEAQRQAGSFTKRSGTLVSTDKVWFRNDSLGQTLVIELYTDHFRTASYHFYNHDIPTYILERMDLQNNKGERATIEEKSREVKNFISQAVKTDGAFFRTNRWITLGDTLAKSIKVYGEADKRLVSGGIEQLEWNFTGDKIYDGKSDLKGKPLVKDNFGHHVIHFFRKGKLIAQVLENDIP